MTKISLTDQDLLTAELTLSAADLEKINLVLDSKFNSKLLEKKTAQSMAAADTAKIRLKNKEKLLRRWFLNAPADLSISGICKGIGMSANPVRNCLFALAQRRKLEITKFDVGKNVEKILRSAYLKNEPVTYSPIFSYAGGKTYLKPELQKQVKKLLKKKQFTAYCEPFAGGLGSFLSVNDILPENFKIQLNDINQDIIYIYKMIKKSPGKFLKKYFILEDAFRKTIHPEARLHRYEKIGENYTYKGLMMPTNAYFNKIKVRFNDSKTSPEDRAVALVFLLNHCYNGYFMKNVKGQFISKFNYRMEDINRHDYEDNIHNLSELFNRLKVEFTSVDYSHINADPDTLFYLDPPYYIPTENRFYTENLTFENQLQIIDKFKKTTFMYSNYKIKEIEEYLTASCGVENISFVNIKKKFTQTDKVFTEILAIHTQINH